eukprot:6738481-Alexandrium_andersonii.AAC.1
MDASLQLAASARAESEAQALTAGDEVDPTYRVSQELGVDRPYLLTDIEVLTRARECVHDLREDLHKTCADLWVADAGTRDGEPITFPKALRERLREAQEKYEPYHALMQQQRGVKG